MKKENMKKVVGVAYVVGAIGESIIKVTFAPIIEGVKLVKALTLTKSVAEAVVENEYAMRNEDEVIDVYC